MPSIVVNDFIYIPKELIGIWWIPDLVIKNVWQIKNLKRLVTQ